MDSVFDHSFINLNGGMPFANSKPGMMYYDKAPELRLKYFNELYKIFSKLI